MHTYKNLLAALFVLVLLAGLAGPAQALPVQIVLPIAEAGIDQSVNTLTMVSLDGSGSVDPDQHFPLTYQWTQTSGTAVTLDDPTLDKPSFTAPGDPAVLVFSLVVTDSLSNRSEPDIVTITVNNQAPVANAGPDQAVTTASLVTLDGTASADPDGDLPLTYLWTQTAGPTVTLSDTTVSNPTFTTPNTPGLLTFSLTVTDSLGMASLVEDTVSITVDWTKVYLPIIIKQVPPTAFGKLSPGDGAIVQTTTMTISWAATSPVTRYEYCYDITNDGNCSGWVPVGLANSVSLPGLQYGTTYYWQVRAWRDTDGPTYANGSLGAFWSFTPVTAPSAFVKTSPTNGATGQSLTPTLSWSSSSPVTQYEYCYDTTADNACSTWIPVGTATSVTLPSLQPYTYYYWQVRAWNSIAGPTYANGSSTAFWSFKTQTVPWVKIVSEGFEGAFPSVWELYTAWYYQGNWYDITNYVSWGKRDCQVYSGLYAGWAVGGGFDGSSFLCTDGYPNDIESWMVYGPIDFSNVKDAYMYLKTWYNTEDYVDYLNWGVSIDNYWFHGWGISGNSGGWLLKSSDLKNVPVLGNISGQPQVWIAVWFTSDLSVSGVGAAVDNIGLSICTSASGCTGDKIILSGKQVLIDNQEQPVSAKFPALEHSNPSVFPGFNIDPGLWVPGINMP